MIRREEFFRREISVFDSSVHTVCYYGIISEEMYTVAQITTRSQRFTLARVSISTDN